MDLFLQSAWLSDQGTSGQSPEMPWFSDVVWMVRKSKLRCNRGKSGLVMGLAMKRTQMNACAKYRLIVK